jgi:hypothetical protein
VRSVSFSDPSIMHFDTEEVRAALWDAADAIMGGRIVSQPFPMIPFEPLMLMLQTGCSLGREMRQSVCW